MVPLHMGGLHPFEQALTLLLAFGPFLVLGLVIWRRRREDPEGAGSPANPGGPAVPANATDDGATIDEYPAGATLPNSTQPEPPEDLRTVR